MDNVQNIEKKPIFDNFVLFKNGLHWVTYGIYYLVLLICMLFMFGMMIGMFPGSKSAGLFCFNMFFEILKISVLFQTIWNWGYYAYLTLKTINDKKARKKSLRNAALETIVAIFLLMF